MSHNNEAYMHKKMFGRQYWHKTPEEINRILKNYNPENVRRILREARSNTKTKKVKVKKIWWPLRGTVTYAE